MSETSLLDVYLGKRIPQSLLMTESDFMKYAEDRGVKIRREGLEYFEELGLLFPLCRLKLPVVGKYCVDGEVRKRYATMFNISNTLLEWYKKGYCEDPAKVKFRPWKEYRDGYSETAHALYHPFQFLTLRTIVNWFNQRIPVPQILKDEELERVRKAFSKFWISQESWRDFVARRTARDSKFFSFLISIEDVFLPLIRSHFIGDIEQDDHGFGIWRSLRSGFDPKDSLSKSTLKPDEIINWRIQLSVEARHLDPLEKWYLLVRHATYDERRKLKGEALFAQDCYEIVEMLGLFLQELTGEPQYGPDDLCDGRHGEWKREWYGADVDFVNREVLRKIIYEYGLDYDYRMLLFVEGDTELRAVPIIAEAMGISFAAMGVRLEKLGSYSDIHLRRIEKLLQYAKLNETLVYIMIDNHQNSKGLVEDLTKRKDLAVREENVHVWDIDFEEDNFSVNELVDAAKQLAIKKGVKISLTPEIIEERRKEKRNIGIGDAVVALCEEQTFTLSKADLGEELGLMVAKRIKAGTPETTKIETEISKAIEQL